MITDRQWRRATALEAAAIAYQGAATDHFPGRPAPDPHTAARHITTLATALETWLDRPAPIVTVEAIFGTPEPRSPEGHPMAFSMPDDDMVTITLTAFDNEKVAVPSDFSDPNGMFVAPFTWVEDNTDLGELAVAPVTLSANVRSHVGQAGLLTLNITDVNGKAMAPVTVQIDPGAATSVGAVFGQPVPRDDNPPA